MPQQYDKFHEFERVRLRRDATYEWLYSRRRYIFLDPEGHLPTVQDPGTIMDVYDVAPPGYEVEFYDAATGDALDVYSVYEDEIAPW